MTLPNFVIAGAMKTGTTTVSETIAAHPEGFVPERKEPHFFDADHQWRRGVHWYRGEFASAGEARAIGDATPLYMFYPRAIERMAQVIPEARLIVCVRNPIDRAYAQYLHLRQRDGRERRTFEDAVADELRAGAPRPATTGEHPLQGEPGYIAQGRYLEQIESLEHHYAPNRIHVVLLDDLERDPIDTFRGVFRFLGIDDGVMPAAATRVANAHIEFRPEWLWQRMQRHGVVRRAPRRPARWFVERFMMRAGVPYDPVAGSLRDRLRDYFAPHNAALGRRLGRDLSDWR